MVPVTVPDVVGVKLTTIEQGPPGGTIPPHERSGREFRLESSLLRLSDSLAVSSLLFVTVTMTRVEVCETATLPKSKEVLLDFALLGDAHPERRTPMETASIKNKEIRPRVVTLLLGQRIDLPASAFLPNFVMVSVGEHREGTLEFLLYFALADATACRP